MNQAQNALGTLALTFLLAAVARADATAAPQEVYGRLVAPCCWNQTLDIHDSEVSTRLRVEVAARLKSGEASVAIEDDLATEARRTL